MLSIKRAYHVNDKGNAGHAGDKREGEALGAGFIVGVIVAGHDDRLVHDRHGAEDDKDSGRHLGHVEDKADAGGDDGADDAFAQKREPDQLIGLESVFAHIGEKMADHHGRHRGRQVAYVFAGVSQEGR